MKDTADTKTADLLPTPKRRGRPAKENALTAAERKRQQRMRERNDANAAKLSTTGLIERMQGTDYTDAERKAAWIEFGKRKEWSR